MIDHADAIKKRLMGVIENLDTISNGIHSNHKMEYLLTKASLGLEIATLDMRNYVEFVRPRKSQRKHVSINNYGKELYGEITITEYDWVHIKINSLLPHFKYVGSTYCFTDSIIRLLDHFTDDGGLLPMYEKAFIAIEERCTKNHCEAFDHDNKGYKCILNALKGRLFPDDNQFELSLSMFTKIEEENCCHIFVLPENQAGDFMYARDNDFF